MTNEPEYEWGPWIRHNPPSPCPVPLGTYFGVEIFGLWRGHDFQEGFCTEKQVNAPDWWMEGPCDKRAPMILKYRIRHLKTPPIQVSREEELA